MATKRGRPRQTRAQQEFVSESEEILERLREGLADLIDQRDRGSEADPELINQLFRSAHSLKGLSGMFGFDVLADLSHHLEDILDGLRMGRVPSDSPLFALLDESVQVFAAALAQVGAGNDLDSVSDTVSDLIGRMEDATQPPAAMPRGLEELDLGASVLRALTEYEEHRLRESLRRGRRILMVDLACDMSSFEESLQETSTAIREVGEVISTLPSPGDSAAGQIVFSLLVATELEPEALRVRLELPEGSTRQVGSGSSPPARRVVEDRRESEAGAEAVAQPPAAPRSFEEPPGYESLKSIGGTVRVDIRKLDELMNLVGELVIQRGAITAIATQLASQPGTARAGMELRKIHDSLERRLAELQASVLEVRMVPLQQVFEKLSRVVRRLRHDLGKEVRLEIRGADTELDKLIVEELVDPLMHLVRNAFDHAIEAPEDRVAAGKSAEGTIRIDAAQRGNHVVIQVSDDGRGIDADAVRSQAEALGVITPGQSLSRAEVLELVFAPGLSTRTQVTGTSGRGVGMDVVRANLSAIGGMVAIDSQPARGTRITMTLPITLAIVRALLVGVRDQRFAIPLNAVLETLMLAPGTIQRSAGREILNLRGAPLPLRRLDRIFRLGNHGGDDPGFAVVVGLGEQRLGLLVDRLEGQQDTVVKPIQGPAGPVRGIAGATELGDQRAVLMLDVAALVEDLSRREAA